MDTLLQMPSVTILITIASFWPKLLVRSAALMLVVLMTRQTPSSRERRLVLVALGLLLGCTLVQACWAGLTAWQLSHDGYLAMPNRTATLILSGVSEVIHLLDLAAYLLLAWTMAQVLRKC